MNPRDTAIEALEKAQKMLYAAANRGHYPPEALQENGGEGLGFLEVALAALRSEVQEEKPLAWMWKQLMHDYMGGWETKIETFPPSKHVKPEDIRDLTPLYTRPQPPKP